MADNAVRDDRSHDDGWRGEGPPVIVACPDGPLLVRGDIDLVDADGLPIERHRRTVALCRCGASAVKPFCDGTHKLQRRAAG